MASRRYFTRFDRIIYANVTDTRQTDGRTDTARSHRPRLCIASRGKNPKDSLQGEETPLHHPPNFTVAVAPLRLIGQRDSMIWGSRQNRK